MHSQNDVSRVAGSKGPVAVYERSTSSSYLLAASTDSRWAVVWPHIQTSWSWKARGRPVGAARSERISARAWAFRSLFPPTYRDKYSRTTCGIPCPVPLIASSAIRCQHPNLQVVSGNFILPASLSVGRLIYCYSLRRRSVRCGALVTWPIDPWNHHHCGSSFNTSTTTCSIITSADSAGMNPLISPTSGFFVPQLLTRELIAPTVQ